MTSENLEETQESEGTADSSPRKLRGRSNVPILDTVAFSAADFDLQAGGPGLTPLEAIEAYPEGAAIAAKELGVTVDELKIAFKIQLLAALRVSVLQENAKRRLPIVGDPNEPKNPEPKLLQIQEPRGSSVLNEPVGEGSTTLDMWRYRAEKAEAEREQYRLEIEQLLGQLSGARNDVQTLLIVLRDRERAAQIEDLLGVLEAIEARNPTVESATEEPDSV